MHFSKVALLVLGGPYISKHKDLRENNYFRGGPYKYFHLALKYMFREVLLFGEPFWGCPILSGQDVPEDSKK